MARHRRVRAIDGLAGGAPIAHTASEAMEDAMKRTIMTAAAALILGAAALAPAPATANGVEQLRESLRQEILSLYPETDVDGLSAGQLARIHLIAHSQRSESSKRMLIRSALGPQGPGTLRSLFLN
jgi:hypothetical protein